MDVYMQLIMNSMQIAAAYILFSLGLTLIFGVMRIVNFAHGEFFTLPLLVMGVTVPFLISEQLPLFASYALSGVLGIALTLLLGGVIYKFALQRFQRDMTGSFVVSVGLSLLLQGIFLESFGGVPNKLPALVEGTVNIMGAYITIQRLIITCCALLVAALMCWTIASSRLGKALRAVSEDHEAAMLQGIPYRRIALAGFFIATSLAAIAAVLLSPVTVSSPIIGSDYLIRGFIAIVIGGLGSIPGAILGSLLIAVIESLGGYYFDPTWATITMFVLTMFVLLVRPKGILGNG
ncbi:branched-chain amino acid ABC transporter permease [Achromobacter sp. ES-001]|nr:MULTISPECIES: branched-chain amino acid ABC transporter permease [Achromobacter]QYJ20229.1 branched-chain amino acid ABC transporter permease [Achromobacter sp. ES-001]